MPGKCYHVMWDTAREVTTVQHAHAFYLCVHGPGMGH